jgi:oxygen-independent coproporphyrinogen-3 oxidase
VSTPGAPFALYVHIPFCEAKCTYCDFNSYAGQDSLMAPYAEAVAREAELWAPAMAGRTVETVFFGGGTPSLLPPHHLATIIEALQASFDIAPDAEVSLEANPGTVDEAYFAAIRRLGVNRLSMGAQSFHESELRRLERIHDGDAVREAYAAARRAGFENINLDLIYGLIGQDMASWQANLEVGLALAPEHLSLYALTLEEGTPLTRDVERGRSLGPDLDLQAEMYEWSRGRMAAAGYDYYEVSNWARPGRQCRHNLTYWRNGDWLGLGAGAHSHLFGERFADISTPSRYIKALGPGEGEPRPYGEGAGVASILDTMPQVGYREPPDEAREMSETVILALRLREGLDLAGFESRYGRGVDAVFPDALRECAELGLTEVVDGRLRLRDEAVFLGDEASVRFLPGYRE